MRVIFLTSKDEAGASPGSGWATVAMFVVGKWWLCSQDVSQLKHRDLHVIWAPQPSAARYGTVQLAGWDDRRACRVRAPWLCAGIVGARAAPRPGISRGSSFPANCVYAINKYVYVYVCCYVTILEQLGPLGSKHLSSAGKRKGSKWCGNA